LSFVYNGFVNSRGVATQAKEGESTTLQIPICNVRSNKEFMVVNNRQCMKHAIQNTFKQLLKIT
jgi:hypothetical protein